MAVRKLIPIGSFGRDQIAKMGLVWAVIFWLIGTFSLVITYTKLPPVIPLFYSLVRGEMQLANKPFILVLPALSLVLILTHGWLARVNFQTDRLFARIIAVTSSLVAFLFMVALLHIIIIVR